MSKGLEREGFEVQATPLGRVGVSMALQQDYDLVILDLHLPDMDGMDVLRSLREAGRATRVLLLTSRASVEDRIRGLESGADDYLAKPFDFGELLARVRALLRRTPLDVSSSMLRMGDLELDTKTRFVTRAGQPIRLPAKQFAILEYLMRRPNDVVSRQDLAQSIWSSDPAASNNVIDVTVHLLRDSVDKGFPQSLIHTVRGVGYRLGVDTHAVPPATSPAGSCGVSVPPPVI